MKLLKTHGQKVSEQNGARVPPGNKSLKQHDGNKNEKKHAISVQNNITLTKKTRFDSANAL